MTLARMWQDADAVVRIRISGHDPNAPEMKHAANVLNVWKRTPSFSGTDTLTFVQSDRSNEIEPYVIGQEFVMLLKWSRQEQAFSVVAAFATEDGRVHSGPILGYVGKDDQQLGSDLASLTAR